MTMVCCDTPIPRPALFRAGPTTQPLDERASRVAGHLATSLKALARTLAEHHRRRLDQAALDALPADLRKDLGWPAGDTDR